MHIPSAGKAHSFNPEFACRYGVNEAIVIASFQWWIDKNRADGRHFVDGRTWTYNTYRSLANSFPYWTPRQVRGYVDSLLDQGVLVKRPGESGEGNWYGFADESQFVHNPPAENGRPLPKTADPCRKRQTPAENGSKACPKRQTPAENGSPPAENGSPNKETVSDSVADTVPDESVPDAVGAAAAAAQPDSPPSVEDPPDVETQALRFFNEALEPAAFSYHRMPPGRAARADYLRALEGWLAQGLVPTAEQISDAVADACASYQRLNRTHAPVSAEPLIAALAARINPAPETPGSASTFRPRSSTGAPRGAFRPDLSPQERHASMMAILGNTSDLAAPMSTIEEAQ